MSDLDELRKRFYQTDDPDDPFGLGLASSSTAVNSDHPGPGSGPSTTSTSRRGRGTHSSSNYNSGSGSGAGGSGNGRRPGPYPQRTSNGAAASGAKRRGGGGGDTSFMARARAAPDDGDGDGDRTVHMDLDTPLDPLQARARTERTLASFDHDLDLRLAVPDARFVDIRRLARLWANERHAPDLLPHKQEFVEHALGLLRDKAQLVSLLRQSDTEGIQLSDEDHYMSTLLQTECERLKFLIRSYVRTRLHKIESYAAHLLATPSHLARLSPLEARHATRYAALLAAHLSSTVLTHLPVAQQALDETGLPGVPNMVRAPDLSTPVFFHAFTTVEGLQLDDGTTGKIEKGGILLVPYRVIEQQLLRDEGELV